MEKKKTSPPGSLEPAFFKGLLGCIEDPVFVKNSHHQWIYANRAFEELVGSDDLIGKTDADLLPADQVQKFYDGDDFVINTQTSLTQEEIVGDSCYALVKKIPIPLPDNSRGLFGIIFDISEYRKVQLEVEKLRLSKEQSLSDPLTGLANRRHLDEYYAHLIQTTGLDSCSRGVLHIDLDHFKDINDTKGHLVGDAVLVHVAEVLRDCLRQSDFIARIGGDEFVVIVPQASEAGLEATANRLLSAFSEPTTLNNEVCVVGLSVGIALDRDNRKLQDILKLADLALYRAKHDGRNRFKHFTKSLLTEDESLRGQRDELRKAIKEREFFPYYQPQFDTQTLEITGAEALARWNHPERGILAPGAFLELAAAERSLAELDRQIVTLAISDARYIADSGLHIPKISVNVSSKSLATSDLIDEIESCSPFPVSICIELLESMLLDEPTSIVSENLARLRAMGISLDIDDFGSGHTSLLGVLEVKPDRIKIDRRLVIPMLESKKHRGIVQSIIQIAESLGMQTVAEGVESEEHRRLLLEYNCSVIQGFGFAKPMPLADLVNLLGQKAA